MKKGHGTSLRRHTMTSILKRDDSETIPPSRFFRITYIGATFRNTQAESDLSSQRFVPAALTGRIVCPRRPAQKKPGCCQPGCR